MIVLYNDAVVYKVFFLFSKLAVLRQQRRLTLKMLVFRRTTDAAAKRLFFSSSSFKPSLSPRNIIIENIREPVLCFNIRVFLDTLYTLAACARVEYQAPVSEYDSLTDSKIKYVHGR